MFFVFRWNNHYAIYSHSCSIWTSISSEFAINSSCSNSIKANIERKEENYIKVGILHFFKSLKVLVSLIQVKDLHIYLLDDPVKIYLRLVLFLFFFHV